ncbi:carbohydrate ABC transporter permease [Paenibacillus sp. LHD-38]|uniref:carbohydrate ABC transporter permease n=1 Tax=Paenibacillus sp. LHD-38 TaxID=3072143 RepID=UPI00280C65CF|nr:carbohydrate ABC transporter permease [Paenibacillus sp. LHD-38]MDQ8736345.1 carbohydrate ABC transporter permease [Paenibacillus sp. LHD-38]
MSVSTAKIVHRFVIYLILIAGSVAMIFPFAWLIRSSLMSTAQIFTFPPEWIPKPFEWSNYSDALTVVPFFRYFLNTMLIEVTVVSGVVITSAMAGYSFARLKWPGRNLMFGLLLSTLMLPYAVTLIPTFVLWKSLGAINTYWPLIVPAWFGGGAFNIFLLRQFFSTIPKDLDEAAYMDGASPLTVLWKIMLPLSKPALIVILIFTFIGTWNDFLGPLIYLSDGNKFTLALGLASFRGMYNAQWGYLMAASTAIVAPIIVLFFIGQRYFIEGITLTGIKG